MEETVHVNGRDYVIELPDPEVGEGHKLYTWRVNESRKRQIRELAACAKSPGLENQAGQASADALKRVARGFRVTPKTTFQDLQAFMHLSRARRRGSG